MNVAALLYALAAFIRFRYGWEDVLSSFSMRFFSWKGQRPATEQAEPSLEARRA